MKRFTEEEARKICGNKLVDRVLSEGVEPTSRLMYPSFERAEHLGRYEYSNCVSDGVYELSVYFYLTEEEEQNLDNVDWGKGEYEFIKN